MDSVLMLIPNNKLKVTKEDYFWILVMACKVTSTGWQYQQPTETAQFCSSMQLVVVWNSLMITSYGWRTPATKENQVWCGNGATLTTPRSRSSTINHLFPLFGQVFFRSQSLKAVGRQLLFNPMGCFTISVVNVVHIVSYVRVCVCCSTSKRNTTYIIRFHISLFYHYFARTFRFCSDKNVRPQCTGGV